MMRSVHTAPALREVRIPAGNDWLYGGLALPAGFHGLVLFAHGSGSGRHSACHPWLMAPLGHRRKRVEHPS